jgi:hypothetical protein
MNIDPTWTDSGKRSATECGDEKSPLIGMTLLDGEDRPTIGTVYDVDGQPMSLSKTIRVPADLVAAAEARNHPLGFSGVVRDALIAYLKPETGAAEVRHALSVLTQAVSRLEAA